MKKLLLLLGLTLTVSHTEARIKPTEKPRVLISTDIGGTDPDDNQSMTHLMMYSDEFDLEGLVSSPSFGSGSAKEIYRMIDVYEKDYPLLKQHANVMAPDTLRRLVKQGRTSELPPCGYDIPTEGSNWIIQQARRPDSRPLYVLVWGCLEDVAQALHDAPDIASKIRVYWIGGPNKKWGINGYCYIIEHFPHLWMIENNTTYRAFIYDTKNRDQYNMGFYNTYVKDAGHLGADFGAYYKGNPKLGDTPSLLYMMDGNPTNPEALSWGGRFVKCKRTPRSVFRAATTAKDTVQICGIIEWQLKGPKRKDIAKDSACITLDIRNQKWKGYYKGYGKYVVRHSTYYTGTLDYTITSTVKGFKPIKAQITVENTWNRLNKTDYQVGQQWWTDSYDAADYWHNCAGARYQYLVREEIMKDWALRWSWLKQPLPYQNPESLAVKTVTIFKAAEGTDHYSNGVVMTAFKDKLYCMWQSSPKDEDSDDTWVAYSTSSDGGETWSHPMPLALPTADSYCTSGGWLVRGDTITAFIDVWPTGLEPRGGHTCYITSTDGTHWSELLPVLMADGSPMQGILEQDPITLSSGRIIGAAHFQPGLHVCPVYTNDTTGHKGWNRADFACEDIGKTSRLIEPSQYLRSDGSIVMLFRDQKSTFRKFTSISTDQGASWTKPAITDYLDARTKQCAGNLPDGTAFMVSCPSGSKKRWPLVLQQSADGVTFNQNIMLRSAEELSPRRYEGKYKTLGYNYPKAFYHNGHLYITYSTNKEDVEITIKRD